MAIPDSILRASSSVDREAEIHWQRALSILHEAMTHKTFDTWLAGTQVVEAREGMLVIGVASQSAKECIEGRLLKPIRQALVDVGYGGAVSFVVASMSTFRSQPPFVLQPELVGARPAAGQPAPLQPDQVAVQFVEFNLLERGWLKVPTYYELFWQPVMGYAAYAFWRYQQVTNFTSAAYTRDRVIDIGRAAAHIGVHREVLKGPNAGECDGALRQLIELGIGTFAVSGRGNHTVYRGKVRRHLPLLSPAQAARLPEALQEEHARWLVNAGFDLDTWLALEEIGVENLATLSPADPAYPVARPFAEPEWDAPPIQAGGFFISPSYYDLFLQPLIGPIGYALWRIFRCLFYNPDGRFTHERIVTVAMLAGYVNCDRQKITGCRRSRDGRPVWQEGAFDLLRRERVAAIREEGHDTRKAYRIRVVNTPPMLTPKQAERLPPVLRQAHDDWLERARLDLDAWQQLDFDSLLSTARE